ncbi:MAG: TipAS antibiotic-recognition domain-containing protein [Bacillota bacterium]|nr:TipAS antibiotic-recognition domain-containing protein [Bacillota bacterium]
MVPTPWSQRKDFRGLGDLYVEDERFTANIDKVKPGLASFLRVVMHFYCDNLK